MWKSLAFLIIFATVETLFGQGVNSTIHGTVEDVSGARIPSASVEAINVLTGESHATNSDAAGDYVFPVLPVGSYRLVAQAAGFKKFLREGLTLTVNQNARVNVRLEVGDAAESIRVVADAPLIDTRQAQLGGLVDARRVDDLPLNGRNVYDLVAILPGVTRATTPTVQDNQGNFMNVNGSRSRHSNFMLDGGFNNSLWRNAGNAAPNPDAVQEFRLITSNFNAEFGRSPGAVVNVVTKSGTNKFHGTAFEYLRNNKLTARNFFQPTVDPLRQNQFGLTMGGPVLRNKTFFFASYQGLRIRSSEFKNAALPPTAAERKGDFSAALANARPNDPTTLKPFPGGIIPVSSLDPVAVKMLDVFVPLPNTPDGRLEVSQPSRSNEDQVLAKIDHQLSAFHKLYGSVFVVQGKGFSPFEGSTQIAGYAATNTFQNQRNVIVNEDWLVSPAALNQVRFGYTRTFSNAIGLERTSWPELGSQVALGALPARPPQITVTGRWVMSGNLETQLAQQSFNWNDTFSYMRNRHNFKAGALVLLNRMDQIGAWLGPGQVRFSGGFTKNVLADFMLGRANTFRQNNGQDRHFTSGNYHGFVQDDWHILPRLTLNLGLRYEVDTPYVSNRDEYQTFRFNTPSKVIPKAPLGLLFPGDPGVPRGIAKMDLNNFAPRFGLAFDPFGNGKTAIRAGYGIFYAIGFANFASDMQGQPFLVDVTVFGTPNLVNPYADVPGGSPFPYKLDRNNPLFSLPVTAGYMSENIATPYIQHYSLTVEQQIMKDLSVQVAYVGNTSRKLSLQRDVNAPIFTAGSSTAANVNARRPYLPGVIAQVALTESASNADYNSMQMTVNRRFSRGFSLLASYTFGKSIDEISEDKFNPTAVALTNSNNRRLDRSVSDFDTRQVLTLSYVWELPKVRRLGLVGRQVLSNWQLNGITSFRTGNPINIVSGQDTNLDGNNNDRPNIVGDPSLSGSQTREQKIAGYFNVAAFRAASTGSDGTTGRNILYGPGASNWTVSLFKLIEVRERQRIQFRAEFFNFFNHTNLGNPNATLSSSNFGRILSAGAARVIQFGLKYSF